jgi:hypothetical protein
VQAFLRGPEQSATFHCFNNLPQARSWSDRYFSWGGNGTYSAKAVPGGRGAKAYSTLTKTRTWFKEQQRQHAEVARELQAVRALLLLEGGGGDGE